MAVAEPGQRPHHPDDAPAERAAQAPGELKPSWQWALALLPSFPLILLVLRLWTLSRQDVPTMLILVRHVSPLGLVASLVISLAWVPPVVILTVRVLGDLLRACADDGPARPSWLTRTADRLPGWVAVAAGMWAALSWELRFLPTLGALLLAVFGLAMRRRYPPGHPMVGQTGVLLPIVVGVAELAWMGPAILAGVHGGEPVTALLLAVPPVIGPFLTGPLPPRLVRAATHWPATVAAFIAPIAIGAIFLRTPILATVALEVGNPTPTQLTRGGLVDVDDHMTLLLGDDGDIDFIRNDLVQATTLCPDADTMPYSTVSVHGWQVERTALQWLLPTHQPTDDPRCEGRLPPGSPGQ